MATPNDVLRIAASQIGYYAPSDPEPGSKYGRWMARRLNQSWLAGPSTSIWWCMIFVSWVMDQAGQPMPGLPGFNCDNVLGKASGLRLSNIRDARAGDIVIFDWTGNGSGDHTGFVEANRGTYLQTIEGNTSSGTAGSQSAGNGVWRRTRAWGSVKAIIRPQYDGTATVVTASVSTPTRIAEDGLWGADTTGLLQTRAGTPVDREIWHQWPGNKSRLAGVTGSFRYDYTGLGSPAIKWLQSKLGTAQDGLLGENDINAMIRRSGGTPDGKLDSPSRAIKWLQNALNAGAL